MADNCGCSTHLSATPEPCASGVEWTSAQRAGAKVQREIRTALRIVSFFMLVFPIAGLFTGYYREMGAVAIFQAVMYFFGFLGLRALARKREAKGSQTSEPTSHGGGLSVMAAEYTYLTGLNSYADNANRWLGNILGANAWGTSLISSSPTRRWSRRLT